MTLERAMQTMDQRYKGKTWSLEAKVMRYNHIPNEPLKIKLIGYVEGVGHTNVDGRDSWEAVLVELEMLEKIAALSSEGAPAKVMDEAQQVAMNDTPVPAKAQELPF